MPIKRQERPGQPVEVDMARDGWPRGRDRSCACKRASSERCKSAPYPRNQYEADRNCVAARRGGEQRKANNQSVGDELDSAMTCDELSSVRRSPERQSVPPPGALGRTGPTGPCRGSLSQVCRAEKDADGKAAARRVRVVGDGMAGRRCGVKQGELPGPAAGPPVRAAVRAAIVARKPGNSGGAKGGRKTNPERTRA